MDLFERKRTSENNMPKMPEGKDQFGIIVPKHIHREAKRMAVDLDCRISDVYTKGIESLIDAKNSGKNPQEKRLFLRHLASGLDPKKERYMEAIVDFIDSDPSPDRLEMLNMILGKYLSNEKDQH